MCLCLALLVGSAEAAEWERNDKLPDDVPNSKLVVRYKDENVLSLLQAPFLKGVRGHPVAQVPVSMALVDKLATVKDGGLHEFLGVERRNSHQL